MYRYKGRDYCNDCGRELCISLMDAKAMPPVIAATLADLLAGRVPKPVYKSDQFPVFVGDAGLLPACVNCVPVA